ncbi:hypothetical protein FPRO06_06371 [Fusarium proliferatum]|nr:hypothetical protein FPRO06_06371 [Fusarium proliferatum]
MATNNAIKAGSVHSRPPGLDIFKTPENPSFYSANLYETLDKSKQEIRLIEISTQTGRDGVLDCRLLPAMFLTDIRKQYLALSYCAGDPTDTKDILVNGVRCNIFANLHHALVLARRYWVLSSRRTPLRLWVDQLCINQRDLKERSHQVGFMREIYQGAERTLACLSTTKDDETRPKWFIGLSVERILAYVSPKNTRARGLKWLIDLCEAVTSRGEDTSFRFKQEESDREHKPDSEDTSRGSKETSDNDEHERIRNDRYQSSRMQRYIWENMHREEFVNGWIAFYDVLSSPWWNRAWICQEFLVSEHVSFMFGHNSISWEWCCKIMQDFCELHSSVLLKRNLFLGLTGLAAGCPEDRQFCRILDIVQERDLSRQVGHVWMALNMKICWSGSMDIRALLSHSRSCKSSDDRDRVYAMLGLASPGYNIFPDYSKEMNAVEVMTLTTRAIIEKEKSLEILVQATRLTKLRNLDVPSWVVDWSSTEDSDADFMSRKLYGKSFIPYESPQYKFETITNTNSQTWHVLWVYGAWIEEIRRVTREWPFAAFDSGHGVSGRHGRALVSIAVGDEVWYLYGSRVPMVLRPCLDGYQVVSSATLLGRSLSLTEDGPAKRRRIKLY